MTRMHPAGPTRDVLFDFVAGRLHDEASQWVKAHCEDCAICAETIERLDRLHEQLQAPPEPPFARQRTLVEVRRRLSAPPAPRMQRRGWLWVASACAALAIATLGVSALWRHQVGTPSSSIAPPTQAPVASRQIPWTIVGRAGMIATRSGVGVDPGQALPADTALTLQGNARLASRWGRARVLLGGTNDGAKLTVRRSDERVQRVHLERGQVVMAVTPRAGAAQVEVVTAHARVVVKGTVFSVSVTPRGTTTAVARGRVDVVAAGRRTLVPAGFQLAPGATVPVPLTEARTKHLAEIERWFPGGDPGWISLRSKDPGATAAVGPHDNTFWPLPLSVAVPAGQASVQVRRSDGSAWTEVLSVHRGEATEVDVPQEPPPAPEPRLAARRERDRPARRASPAKKHREAARLLERARDLVHRGAIAPAMSTLDSLRATSVSAGVVAQADLLEGQLMRMQGKARRAVALFTRVARTADGQTAEQALSMAGETYAGDLRDPKAAADAWSEYRERFPRGMFHREAPYRLGRALVRTGQLKQGAARLEEYLDGSPRGHHSQKTHALLGQLYAGPLQRCAEALAHLEAVTGEGSARREALVQAARCQRKLKRGQAARRAYRRYLELAPNGEHAAEARAGSKER